MSRFSLSSAARDWALALNPETNKIYVGDSEGTTLSVIDGRSGSVYSVQVGKMPGAIAVDSGSNRIYVANYGSNSVTVLEGANDAIIATMPVEARPQALAADSVTHVIYVANTGSHSVSVISGEGNSVIGTVQLESGPYAITASNGLAYVECLGHDGLFAIDPRTLSVSAVSAVVDAQQSKRREISLRTERNGRGLARLGMKHSDRDSGGLGVENWASGK